MILGDLVSLNAFQIGMIFYLTIADGMNNPVKIAELYAHNPLIRFLYSVFGAYNVFGSDVGMGLGFKKSLAVSAVMMILLDLIPMMIQPKSEQDEVKFVPFFSYNTQTYISILIFIFMYMYSNNQKV